jgi:murein DD-endopeptidase MepM/ murein hydrolase activator NlpD
VVQPGDTIYKIARKFGVSPAAIIRANNLSNPDKIFPGQTLIIPTGATATSAPASVPAGPTGSGSGFTVTVGSPIYSGDGRVVDIPLTVHNQSVSPAIAGGKFTSDRKPDGKYEDVALLKALHGTFETPLTGTALLWQANVHLSDGSTHFMTVGCRFIEHVFAQGDEPLERTPEGVWLKSFHYEINLFDGWFDCGNTYRLNPKDIAPGTSGSSVLTVYLVNPHNIAVDGKVVGAPYPGRKVTGLDLTVFTPTGGKVGTASVAVP